MSALRACTRPLLRTVAVPRTTVARSFRSVAAGSRDPGSSSSPGQDPWAHIFEAIDEIEPRLPTPTRTITRNQRMTAGEKNVFESMFDMIFAALDQQQQRNSVRPLGIGLNGVSIGNTAEPENMADRARGRTQPTFESSRGITQDDLARLDRMREEVELCDTDAALLTWARNHVFTEEVVNGSPSRLYPALLALLMRTFRERFEDPHLALSVFEHARNLNIPSFVFGCTTDAYNELLTTRWVAFRDLRGVRDALEEMKVNGVRCNGQIRTLVNNIRKEVGERNAWLEDSLSSSTVWSLLMELDTLTAEPEEPRRARRDARHQTGNRWRGGQEWKRNMRDTPIPAEDDGLEDDMWSVDLFREPSRSDGRQQQSSHRSVLV